MTNSSTQFTKRARYEILRRDNFTCRYCGAKAPDVQLEVDHVTPVALGGLTTPENAATACSDCNRGKSATAPDAEVIADTANTEQQFQNVLRSVLHRIGDESVTERADEDAWVSQLSKHWVKYLALDEQYPQGFERTLMHWRRIGCPAEIILYAMDATTLCDNLYGNIDRQWRYTCAIVWNKITEAGKEAAAHA